MDKSKDNRKHTFCKEAQRLHKNYTKAQLCVMISIFSWLTEYPRMMECLEEVKKEGFTRNDIHYGAVVEEIDDMTANTNGD